MSLLIPRTSATPKQEFVEPSKANVWRVGDAVPSTHPGLSVPPRLHETIRQNHNNAIDSDDTIFAALHVVPTPVALSAKQLSPEVARVQNVAASELNAHNHALSQPSECHVVPGLSAPGVRHYETVNSLERGANLETLSQNMATHDLSLKWSFSHPNFNFTPFAVALTHADLNNCMAHAAPVTDGGMISKFLESDVAGSPHKVLFHIAQDADTQKHYFYGINLTKRDTYSH